MISTLDVLRSFAASSTSCLTWQSEPDNGQSHAVNKAFAASTGEVVGWLNSDDAYFSRHVIADVVAMFDRMPDVDVIYGHAALVNADGLVLHSLWVPPYSYRLLRHHNFIIQPAAFVRRAALRATMVDETFDYAMDRELWLRLGQSVRMHRAPQILAIDRHHLSRKVMTMHEVAEQDSQRLDVVYDVAHGRITSRTTIRACSVLGRFLGLRLLRFEESDLAFSGSVDSVLRLLRRQVATRRSAMPAGAR